MLCLIAGLETLSVVVEKTSALISVPRTWIGGKKKKKEKGETTQKVPSVI
jgi:hypothetical protein